MKRIKVTKLRIIAISFLALFIMLLILIPVFSRGSRESVATVDVDPPFAPVQYTYPDILFEDLSDGFSWRINENALELKDEEGIRYQVTPDGVYQINPDGSMTAVTDEDVLADILAAADEAASNSEEAASYLGDDYLTDDEVYSLFGDDADPDTVRALQDAGLTADEIADLLNQGYTLDDLYSLLNRGTDPDDLAALLSSLEDTLSGTGLTVEDLLDYLDSIGITPDQWLEAFRAASQEDQENSAPEIQNQPAAIRAGDLPALTVNLGGSESAAEEREDEYLSYLESITPGMTDPAELASAIAGINSSTSEYTSLNDQAGKTEFMSSFSGRSGYDQLTNHDIAPGTIVTMLLKTGINSDLPGQIVAEVTQNVFDSLTGRNLLIPKGTRLIATYSSSVSWGQERALVAWTQLIRPDGLILNLPGLPGIDAQGYAGYRDKVDNHVWDLIWGAGLASLLEVGVNEINYAVEGSGYQALSEILGLYTDDLGSAAQQWLKNVINQPPTLTIRPGRTINLLVTQKLTLTPYRGR